MDLDLGLTCSTGLATGTVYQFAEGVWPGPIGEGVVLSEAAFDFVLPVIRRAWPDWPELAKYGVTKITPASCKALVSELRFTADRLIETRASPEWAGYSDRFRPEDVRRQIDENPARVDELSGLFRGLADWLETAMARSPVLSLNGI